MFAVVLSCLNIALMCLKQDTFEYKRFWKYGN
jgi:hypothetical protein